MILCLDYGDRYIGIAATDRDARTPYRYGTIDQISLNAVEEVQNIVQKEGITKVIVGVPLSFKREETEQTHKTLAFMEKLRDILGEEVEVEGVDELLSSKEARRITQQEGSSKTDEHAEAARLMLADYLNR